MSAAEPSADRITSESFDGTMTRARTASRMGLARLLRPRWVKAEFERDARPPGVTIQTV